MKEIEFLSTLSLRRATSALLLLALSPTISIHALLAESDLLFISLGRSFIDFYPRSPCGERHGSPILSGHDANFYPRSPCGERRVTVLGIQHRVGISIHALLAESDQGAHRLAHAPPEISIHALLAESDNARPEIRPRDAISIHALLAESDDNGRMRDAENLTISIHALLAESDQLYINRPTKTIVFLSTLSLRRATRRPIFFSQAGEFLSTLSLRRATRYRVAKAD